jgi:hypothetical protein
MASVGSERAFVRRGAWLLGLVCAGSLGCSSHANGSNVTGAAGAGPSGAAGAAGSSVAGDGGGSAGASGSASDGSADDGSPDAGDGDASDGDASDDHSAAASDAVTDVGEAGIDAYGFESGDTLPWRALHVTATAALHVHGSMGLDGRAHPLGKLAVDLGVSGGGYSVWLGKRGYHVLGATFMQCFNLDDWSLGRDVDDRCHQGEWDMISADVKAKLTNVAQQFPEEDWGYFLNQDGSVRWSDVAITGLTEGADTAAFIARVGVRVWRVVARSAPRDNTCGRGAATGPYDPNNPPWFPVATTCDAQHCCLAHIASWIDAPSKTPLDRFYGLAGMKDLEYGDIMFDMDRAGIPGQPITWDLPGASLAGTNRFISAGGAHLDFLNAAPNLKPVNTDAVLNIAFGIPLENQNPTF